MKYIKVLVLLFAISLYSQSGKVVKICDGDTVVLLDKDNNQITIRLAEVDCPEFSQAYGGKAKKFTASEVGMKEVTCEIIGFDKYGRTIAKIFYDGKYLSAEIIKNGWGWHYKKYSHDTVLAELETKARLSKIGLWSDKWAIAPWDFRYKTKTSIFNKTK